MIYIIDDTITQRIKSIEYLWNDPYKDICKIIEYPTVEINREIVTEFSTEGKHLLCIHRSAKYFNNEMKIVDNSDKLRNNLLIKVKQMNIGCVIFGRDMSNNREQKFIDKDLFYRNLKSFLSQWINGIIETDILYDGSLYKIARRKKLLDEIITIINVECPPYDNDNLKLALQQYLPAQNPINIINTWMTKGLSKKEIRQYINDNL
ncbi:MAG: hypothetical protein J5542_08850 [Bacteroidales bacterium]|nr:hypothetical protein [Bacteroidales bacterium]MBR3797539.1 hypothetical protein [Bacteroidales bacterium]